MTGNADYSAVSGRKVAIWPDHDNEGATALLASARACKTAGAAHVFAVDYVGDPDSKQGAADLNPVGIGLHLRALREWVDAPRRDWQWRDLGTFADIPAATHLVNGLLIEGNITLWYAPVKTCVWSGNVIRKLRTSSAFLRYSS